MRLGDNVRKASMAIIKHIDGDTFFRRSTIWVGQRRQQRETDVKGDEMSDDSRGVIK